jgi:hypothetical protein
VKRSRISQRRSNGGVSLRLYSTVLNFDTKRASHYSTFTPSLTTALSNTQRSWKPFPLAMLLGPFTGSFCDRSSIDLLTCWSGQLQSSSGGTARRGSVLLLAEAMLVGTSPPVPQKGGTGELCWILHYHIVTLLARAAWASSTSTAAYSLARYEQVQDAFASPCGPATEIGLGRPQKGWSGDLFGDEQ